MALRVLLVDDERDFVDALAARLDLRGMEVLVAYDGDQALARLAEQDVDVAVLDIQLPGRSGLELIAEVRAARPLAQVVMLTGRSSLSAAVDGMKRGALDYLVKPVDIDVLEAALRSAAERRASQTESRRMIEAGRLLVLGHLARGVAHEISNPVNNMVTAAEWMLDLLEDLDPAACADKDELVSSAAVVRDNGMRCKGIVLRLLTYCGAGDPRARDLNLYVLLAAILERRAERIKKLGVRVELDCAPDLPPVHAAAAELDEAFSALVDNALDAMDPDGGAAAPAGEDAPARRPGKDGADRPRRLRITARSGVAGLGVEVADTGRGMAPEVLPNIFAPFYSTKETGQGVGLGLAIAQRVFHSLGGEITAASAPGEGATFTVRLPV
ncbi:MAG: response regulator [Thermodesulfobacteriota bacterium]